MLSRIVQFVASQNLAHKSFFFFFFEIPVEEWSIVNCMLPTRYYPPLQGNIYERLTRSIAQQLYPESDMTKDYDQLLNKRPGKTDAVFAWHQDMAYWPGAAALGVTKTDTCTFSLATLSASSAWPRIQRGDTCSPATWTTTAGPSCWC